MGSLCEQQPVCHCGLEWVYVCDCWSDHVHPAGAITPHAHTSHLPVPGHAAHSRAQKGTASRESLTRLNHTHTPKFAPYLTSLYTPFLTQPATALTLNLARSEVDAEEGRAFAARIRAPFVECSAKLNRDVDKAFRLLLQVGVYVLKSTRVCVHEQCVHTSRRVVVSPGGRMHKGKESVHVSA